MPKQRTTTKELDQLLQLLQDAMQDIPRSKKNSPFTPQQQLAMVRIGKEKLPTSAQKQKKTTKETATAIDTGSTASIHRSFQVEQEKIMKQKNVKEIK